MQPQTKFWNVVQEEDSAEIQIYGEIVSRRPVDWWTGEPEEGLFTSPEGFLEDLEGVKNAKNVTVRINSVGGDLYTAIAISNRLKELAANTTAIIDGIAASAATVIAMGCKTIKAYPGSLFMVHEALTELFGLYNHKALNEVNKRLEAANSAAAEAYNEKTNLGIEKIRHQMAKESWLTGREAKEEGWIDEVIEGECAMSLSADKTMLTVNGITMAAKSFESLPNSIPVECAKPQKSKPAQALADADIKPNKEETQMTLDELMKTEPELAEQIKASAIEEVKAEVATQISEAKAEAIREERARLQAISEIACSVNDAEMVNEAMYGENACTASELALRAMQKQAKLGETYLKDRKEGLKNSGADDVEASPNEGNETTEIKTEMSMEDAVKLITGKE